MSDQTTSHGDAETQARSGPPKVVITGTSGFIGSHLAPLMAAAGYNVLALDRRTAPHPIAGVEHVECDMLDRRRLVDVVRQARPEYVLHLAARTDLDESENIDGYAVNIAGVENLVEAIRATGTVRRAICTSTQLVCRVGYRPAHNEDYQPSTLYGASKVRTEQIWRAADGAGTEWCLVRPTTIWGPRMNAHYERFFRMIRRGRYFHIGRGPTLKSFGYVGNTVVQYQRLLEAPAARIHRRTFYLADYEPIALEAWANEFQRVLDARPIRTLPVGLARTAARMGDLINRSGASRFPFNSFRLNNVLTPYVIDMAPTRAVCGPLPYTMEAGVRETVEWLNERWAAAA